MSLVNRQARSVPFSAIAQERQTWLWEARIPVSTLSALAGKGGTGKTTYALHLIAQLSRGELPGEYQGQPQTVLIWSGEDKASTQLGPRLTAAGADLTKVRNLVIDADLDGQTGEVTPRLPLDVSVIRNEIDATGARLVLIDPIASTMNGDLHREADVRAALDSLARMAEEAEAVVMYVRHFGKGGGNASDKMSGNHAFRDAARSVFLFAEADDRIVVTQDKGNYSAKGQESFAFRLESVDVPAVNGVNQMARVVDLGASDTSVSDLINQSTATDDPTERDEIDRWLTALLANGSVKATEVYSAADAAGYNKDQAKRAKKRLGIVAERPVNPGPWFWTLAGQGAGRAGSTPEHSRSCSLLPVSSEGVGTPEIGGREHSAGECSLLPFDGPGQALPTPLDARRQHLATRRTIRFQGREVPRCYVCGRPVTGDQGDAHLSCASKQGQVS